MNQPVVTVPPQPDPDVESVGFWEATARGEFALDRCRDCRRWQHPPVERCRQCGGPTAFEPVAGTGTVFSYIVMRRASVGGFEEHLPYVVALIELDDQPGLRFNGRIVGLDPAQIEIGQRVRAEILDVAPGGSYRIPVFRPL